MAIQRPDNRRLGAEFHRRVVNMGSRDIDDLKELGHKLKTVLGGVEELPVLGNLIYSMLS